MLIMRITYRSFREKSKPLPVSASSSSDDSDEKSSDSSDSESEKTKVRHLIFSRIVSNCSIHEIIRLKSKI